MSKYRKIATQFKDAATLREAISNVCQQRHAQFEEGEGLSLYGYRGDRRAETAEFVIRRQFVDRAANDLGFHRLEDGTFEVVISEYDSHGTGAKIVNQIKQEYARLQVSKLARARGLRVEEKREGGVVRLRLVGRVKSQQRVGVRIR